MYYLRSWLRYHPFQCSKEELNMVLSVVIGFRSQLTVIGSLAWKINSCNVTLAVFSTVYWAHCKVYQPTISHFIW